MALLLGGLIPLGLFYITLYYHASPHFHLWHASAISEATKNQMLDVGLEAQAKFLVGELPWADGADRIGESYAGTIDVRSFPDGWADRSDGTESSVASIFFWFFPAINPSPTPPPLIIWLQGGPGSSSMIGLFNEMGPLHVGPDQQIRRNPETWNRNCSMLFIDNPVGTGYSFVGSQKKEVLGAKVRRNVREFAVQPDGVGGGDEGVGQLVVEQEEEVSDNTFGDVDADGSVSSDNDAEPAYAEGYVTNQAAAARDLLLFLVEFYTIFPEQLAAELFIMGESYAGKYVPHFADAIVVHNDKIDAEASNRGDDGAGAIAVAASTKAKIPLAGIAIGNGLTDPVTQIVQHAPLGLALGLLSKRQAAEMDVVAREAVRLAEAGRWVDATRRRVDLFTYFQNVTGGVNWYDVRRGDTSILWDDMNALLETPAVRKALNVPDVVGLDPIRRQVKNQDVIRHLEADVMKTAVPPVERLLARGVRMLAYQGQFDFRDGVLSCNEWIEGLDWSGRDGYLGAERKVWRLASSNGGRGGGSGQGGPGRVAGYVTQHAHLRRVEVLLAGHLSPMDAGQATREMIESFVFG
ncbi:Alpha/Beta hydrolase protein [Zopfochytrium polystomum]|nr:Alpha/Beta hydrolase protein [Zopfochytrium polystomum]